VLLLALLQIPADLIADPVAAFDLPAGAPPWLIQAFAALGILGTLVSGLATFTAIANGAIRRAYGSSPKWLQAVTEISNEIAERMGRGGRGKPAPKP
jgi:hypothetical protein